VVGAENGHMIRRILDILSFDYFARFFASLVILSPSAQYYHHRQGGHM
jgi:hypothetical protein